MAITSTISKYVITPFSKPHGVLPPDSVILVGSLAHLSRAGLNSYANMLVDTLKVLSSHSNWGVRIDSFDLMLNSRCPASFKFFF
jgi:hypothetical protein